MRDALRAHVPLVDADRRQDGDIATVLALIRAGALPIEESLAVN
jgi:histidine ammonia-lyase